MKLLSDQVSEAEIKVVLRELAKTREVEGDVVEFGCFVGTTSVFLARELGKNSPDKRLWLYDSFEGLPEKTREDQSPAGLQFKKGELLASKKQLIKNLKQSGAKPFPIIKKAWFSELSERDIPEKISFAFLDGDYYLSILDPLKLIWPRLSSGAIIIVDDYANEALPGASKAVHDWQKIHEFSIHSEASLGIIQF